MFYFFDAEFTNFKDLEVISLGIISEDKKFSFYKENEEFSRENSSQFVLETVVPLLDLKQHGLKFNDLSLNLINWINLQNSKNLYFIADYMGDLFILNNLIKINENKLEKKVSIMYLSKALELISKERGFFDHKIFEKALSKIADKMEEDFKKDELSEKQLRHHALFDAEVLLNGFQSGLNYLKN